jgi:hypothetical protein
MYEEEKEGGLPNPKKAMCHDIGPRVISEISKTNKSE